MSDEEKELLELKPHPAPVLDTGAKVQQLDAEQLEVNEMIQRIRRVLRIASDDNSTMGEVCDAEIGRAHV